MPFICSHCGRVFRTEVGAKDHVAHTHAWTPRRCDVPGCTDKTVFQTHHSLRYHVDRVHFTPRQCPSHGCTDDTVFQSLSDLTMHRKDHNNCQEAYRSAMRRPGAG